MLLYDGGIANAEVQGGIGGRKGIIGIGRGARTLVTPDTVVDPEFGPSGLIRQKIENGASTDLFASADMEQARKLAVGHPERMVSDQLTA
jgi:hypothetical protein